jgi:hypothetical protein
MNEKQLPCKELSELFNLLCELINKGKENTEEFNMIKELIIKSRLYKIFLHNPLPTVDKRKYRDKFEFFFGTQNKFFTDKFTIINNGNQLEDIFINNNQKDYLKIYFVDISSIDNTHESNLSLLFRFTNIKNLHSVNAYNISNDVIYYLDNNSLKILPVNFDLKKTVEDFRDGIGRIIGIKTKNPYITERIGFAKSDIIQHKFTTDLNIEVICICENNGNEYSEINDLKLSLAFQPDTSSSQFWDMGDLRP